MDRKHVATEEDNRVDEANLPAPVSSASSLDSYLVGLSNFDVMGDLGAFSSSPGPVLLPGGSAANSVPEFLYQLTKMLSDDNREVIEWSNGMIEVHNPRKLETEVLNKYFRHSKFASFQRQLNYFGFRKLAGKGKMAPCSYVNEGITRDLGSLLLIKRKTNATPRERGTKGTKKKETSQRKSPQIQPASASLPATANARMGTVEHNNSQSIGISARLTANSSQADIARSAVGKGIRYSFEARERALSLSAAGPATSAVDTTRRASTSLATGASDSLASLNELENNFRNSLKQQEGARSSSPGERDGEIEPTPLSQMRYNNISPFGGGVLTGFLSRNSSLIDLAMIPDVEDTTQPPTAEPCDAEADSALSFVDFPHPKLDPSSLSRQADSETMPEDNTF